MIEVDQVTIFAPDVQDDLQRLTQTFEGTSYRVQVMGHRDYEDRITAMIEGGNPPDIALFPQPGKVHDFAEMIVPLSSGDVPDEVLAGIERNTSAEWREPVTVGGELLAVPLKADLKSLVWYDPERFMELGYEVPATFEGFLALADEMARDGHTPFCLGLGSEFASGWPLTDWIEEFLLRRVGPDRYDRWVNHDIPFNAPQVVAVAQEVYDFLARPGYVYQGFEHAAERLQADAGDPLAHGHCMMYRMSNYYAVDWPEDMALLGPDDTVPSGDDRSHVAAFRLPGSAAFPDVALTGGMYAAAFSDDLEVMEVMEYLASEDYANMSIRYDGDARENDESAGFLSPNTAVETSRYSELDQEFHEILMDPSIERRFDASDLMPGSVGAGTFWRAAVLISTGEMTVEDAFDEIERDWPADPALETRPGDTLS